MKYDVIIIGGGLAGYTCAIRCLQNGQKIALINNGRSALHFSSGSVDLLSSTPSGRPVRFPFQSIEKFVDEYPEHPYGKLGQLNVSEAIDWFTETMSSAGVSLKQTENNENHQRITTLGTLKSTFLSQQFVAQIGYNQSQHDFERIVLLDVEGFRDFQTSVIADNLRSTLLFEKTPIVNLPVDIQDRTSHVSKIINFRSTDFIKILNDEATFNQFADQISNGACERDLVVLPAIFGSKQGLETIQKLKARTGLCFNEVPTMPPSLMGIRLEEALEKQFIKLGGVLLKGDCVTRGEFSKSNDGLKLEKLWTKNLRDYALTADHFVLASGSFFSNGLKAELNQIIEPVFGLDMCSTGPRTEWYQETFFSPNSHAFLSFGVETDDNFKPSINGVTVNNLACCGSILAHYNPIAEGSGGGVAISTAYLVSNQITQLNSNDVTVEITQC